MLASNMYNEHNQYVRVKNENVVLPSTCLEPSCCLGPYSLLVAGRLPCHNITKQLRDGLIPKKTTAIKKTLIIHHWLSKSSQQGRDTYSWQCRGIGHLGVQRAWSGIMNVLANPKGSVGRWNLNFWRLEQFHTKIWSKGVVDTFSKPIDLSKTNKGTTKMMARKVHVCIKNWEFYLVTPAKCQKTAILHP
jgi:hypothetical protein